MPLFAAALFLSHLQTEPVISKDFGFIRGDLLIEAAGREAGEVWKGAGAVREDLLYANLKGMPVSKVKESLAKVLSAEWTARDGVQILTSNQPGKSALEVETEKAIRKWFAATKPPEPLSKDSADDLIRRASELQKRTGNDYPWRDIQKLNKETPGARALTRVILALGLDYFLKLKEGDRVVVTENPTRMQVGFPPQAVTAISDLKREIVFYGERLAAKGVDQFNQGRFYIPALSMYGSQYGSPGKVQVVFSREYFSGVQAVLTINDSTNQYTYFSENMNLGLDGEYLAQGEAEKEKKPDPLAEFKDELQISKEGENRLNMFSLRSSGSKVEERKPPSKEIVDVITHMDKVEPLEYLLKEPMESFVSKYNKGLLLVVPDMALYFGGSMPDGVGTKKKPSYQSLLRSMLFDFFPTSSPKVETVGDNLVLTPSTLLYSRGMRFNRAAASKLARDLIANRSRIDALADFVVVSDDSLMTQFVPQLFNSVLGINIQFPNGAAMEVLKLYGSLGPVQRQQAAQGGVKINLFALPPHMAKIVQKLVFGYNPYVEAYPKPSTTTSKEQVFGEVLEPAGGSDEAEDQKINELRYGRGVRVPTEEVTVALANGVPPGSVLELKLDKKSKLYGYQKDSPYLMEPQPVDVNSLAWAIAYKEKMPNENYYGAMDRFTTGTQEILSAKFDFPQVGTATRAYVGDNVSSSSTFVDMKGLPADILAKLEARLKEARENMKNADFSPGAGGGPKSPP